MSSKIQKKTKRIIEKVYEQWKINPSLEPTKYLLICNAGLMNGHSHEDLMDIFSKWGSIVSIQLLPHCSYSFLEYDTEEMSTMAFEAVNAKPVLMDSRRLSSNQVLYLSYMESCPQTPADSISEWVTEWPNGLAILEDFINDSEENDLLDCLDWSCCDESLKHRKVLHFGYRFCYDSNTIDKTKPLAPFPDHLNQIVNRMVEAQIIPQQPDQCTVNRYEVGDGIPPHVDSHECCSEVLSSLSLGSDVVMNFASVIGKEKSKVSVLVKRKSLTVLTGEARYAVSHGITPRHSDTVPLIENSKILLTLKKRKLRISFTFRKTLEGPCKCPYPDICPAQQKSFLMTPDTAVELERLHVHSVYDNISGHFSDTRHKRWPNVDKFVKEFNIGSVLIDVGCGNGKYLGNEGLVELACDHSRSLLKICQERGYDAAQSDCLAIPVRSSFADCCICIAVIHHLATRERRIKAIEEMYRVLRPGGKALIYAWAKDQEHNSVSSSYLKSPKTNQVPNDISVEPSCFNLPVHKNRTNFVHSDLLVPWKIKQQSSETTSSTGETFLRYYHVFEEGELEQLVRDSKFGNEFQIEKSFYDQGNWCVILCKEAEA